MVYIFLLVWNSPLVDSAVGSCMDCKRGERPAICYVVVGLCFLIPGQLILLVYSLLMAGWVVTCGLDVCGLSVVVCGFLAFVLWPILFALPWICALRGKSASNKIVAPIVPSSPAVPGCTQPQAERQAHKQQGAGDALPQPIYRRNLETGALEQVTAEQADATDRTSHDAKARKSASKKEKEKEKEKEKNKNKKKQKVEPVQATTSNPMMDMDFMDSSEEED